MKRILWWLLAGSKGGKTRGRIIETLQAKPSNANQLAESLKLDYKTIRHHLEVLKDNQIIVAEGEKYGAIYFLSDEMEKNQEVFQAIWKKVKE